MCAGEVGSHRRAVKPPEAVARLADSRRLGRLSSHVRDAAAIGESPGPTDVDREPSSTVDADGDSGLPIDRDPSPSKEIARANADVKMIRAPLTPLIVRSLESEEQARQKRRPLAAAPIDRQQRGRRNRQSVREFAAALIDVKPDSKHGSAVMRLDEDARKLVSIDHDVVRPLDLRREPKRRLDCLGCCDGADEREFGCSRLCGRAKQDRADDCSSSRCVPRTGGLSVAQRRGTLSKPWIEEAMGRLAAHAIDVRSAESTGKERLHDVGRERVSQCARHAPQKP
jgi:hypothetical protein